MAQRGARLMNAASLSSSLRRNLAGLPAQISPLGTTVPGLTSDPAATAAPEHTCGRPGPGRGVESCLVFKDYLLGTCDPAATAAPEHTSARPGPGPGREGAV